MKRTRVFLIIIGLCLSLAGVEIYLRFFQPEPLGYSLAYSPRGHLWNSGVSGRYKWRDFIMDLQFNFRGERDSQSHELKNPEKTRVLLLGDSITYGWPNGEEQTFRHVLRHQFPDWEFINCSAVTLNSIQLLEIYLRRCGEYVVDLVILQLTLMDRPAVPALFFGSQLGPQFIETSILYDLNGREALTKISMNDLSLLQNPLSPEDIGLLEKLFRPFLPGYDSFHFIRKVEHDLIWRWRYRFRNEGVLMEYGSSSFERVRKIGEEVGIKSRLGQDVKPDTELELEIVRRFAKEAKKRNSKFMVLVVPNALGINLFEQSQNTLAGEAPRPPEELSATRKALHEFLTELEREQVLHLDLSASFPVQRYEEFFLIPRDDVHPSPEGHQWIGQQLTSFLRKATEF